MIKENGNTSINHFNGKCLDCPDCWCLEFHHRTEVWTGYCHLLRQRVNGNDLCHLPRQPPEPQQLELFL